MKECRIHRCAISKVVVYAPCDECGAKMKSTITLTDEPSVSTPVVSCSKCNTSYAILLNITTSIECPNTKLLRL